MTALSVTSVSLTSIKRTEKWKKSYSGRFESNPLTSLLRPSKLHFYCHHHGWVTTHGWPSRHGGHHGAQCMFMKSRPSEFTPAMQAARTPDAIPNHPGSANVQRTNVLPLHQCSPCTLPPSPECPSPSPILTPTRPPVTSAPPIHPLPRVAVCPFLNY